MDDTFEQITLDQFTSATENPSKNTSADQVEMMISQVFEDFNTLDSIKDKGYKPPPLPEEVKKGRSQLLNEVISQQGNEEGFILLEDIELSEITQKVVTSRVSLTFHNNESDTIQYSQVLTNFDREVIDAVASLAPVMQIMTAATIYRVIIGKSDTHPVNQKQRQRVEESMERCANCRVTIDVSSQFSNFDMDKEQSLAYKGAAISHTSVEHKIGKGSTTYYKILDMPPFFRLAERLGKIVIIPLRLLDSPVSKTDAIIAIQSFLFREIDLMKRDIEVPRFILWEDLYKLSYKEGKKPSKAENQRTRDSVCSILDFWIDEDYIKSYESNLKEKNIRFDF